MKAELSSPASDPADASPGSLPAQLRELVHSNLSTTKSCITLESAISKEKETKEANTKRQETLKEGLAEIDTSTSLQDIEKKKQSLEENQEIASKKQSSLSELEEKLHTVDDRLLQLSGGGERQIIQETLERLSRDCSLYQRVVKGAEDCRGKEEKQSRLGELMKVNQNLDREATDKREELKALESTPKELSDLKEQNASLTANNYDMRRQMIELQAGLDNQQAQRNCLENEMKELKTQVNQFVEAAGAHFDKPEQMQEVQDKLKALESCFSKK